MINSRKIITLFIIITGSLAFSSASIRKAEPVPFVLITRLPTLPINLSSAGDAVLHLDKSIQGVRIAGFDGTKLPGGGISFTTTGKVFMTPGLSAVMIFQPFTRTGPA